MFGAHTALLEASGESSWLPERDLYDAAKTRLRSALGNGAYERLEETGRTMPDQAVVADFQAVINRASA